LISFLTIPSPPKCPAATAGWGAVAEFEVHTSERKMFAKKDKHVGLWPLGTEERMGWHWSFIRKESKGQIECRSEGRDSGGNTGGWSQPEGTMS
jgi:hypothetical protein